MDLGQRIRNERKMMNLTLEQLSRKIGISKMTLQRIETGKTSPSIAILGDLAEALHTPITNFIEENSGFIKITRKKDQFSVDSDNLVATNVFPRRSFNSVKIDSLAINYVEASNGAEVKTHTNKGFEWVFQITGKSVFDYDGKEFVSNPGDVFFYDGNKPHSVKYKGKNKFLLISFK